MNIKLILICLTLLACNLFSLVSNAIEPGEGIVFDSFTGNYTVSYFVELEDGSKLLQKTIFEPATKIDPSVRSKYRLEDGNKVIYGYTISTSPQSFQPLDTIRFVFDSKIYGSQGFPTDISSATEAQVVSILDANKMALATPAGWDGGVFPNRTGGVRINWNSINHMGIQPGNSLTGYGFTSQDIPGIGVVELEGIRKRRITYAGGGPQGDVKQQFTALRKKDFVTRTAVIPSIAVPVPFDAAILLDRIRTHVATWPGKQLLDPAFAAQLDRTMEAAANAFRNDQPKAGREHIKSLRKLLAKEHKYLDHDDEDNDDTPEHKAATRLTIDRLAARVLDFDLRYVLKRMEREHEHEHKKDDGRKER